MATTFNTLASTTTDRLIPGVAPGEESVEVSDLGG